MSRKPRFVVFARAPLLGTVKRRLAAGIGDIAARRFYVATTRSLLRRVARDPRWRTELWITPDAWADDDVFGFPATRRVPQGSGDLGARMARALAAEPGAPTVLVGSDIPDIGSHHIAAALKALAGADAVFGPATDGGYWLVGARSPGLARSMFHGVRWSGPHALADTLANLRGRRVVLLQPLDDIDDAADLARWRSTKTGKG